MVRSVYISVLALVGAGQADAQTSCGLKANWGLESKASFEEKQQYADENSVMASATLAGPRLRAFRLSEAGHQLSLNYLQLHTQLHEQYQSEYGRGAIQRDVFHDWAKRQDPYYVAIGRGLAPVLYFDFTGNSGQEYVLDEIDIKTIEFVEYAGGGFFDKRSWYDIELSRKAGVKKYPVGKRLRFTASGRSELRFFSDNYYPSGAQTPMGSYRISITFVFLSNGQQCRFSTDQFMMDV